MVERRNFVSDGSFILGARDLGLEGIHAVCELIDNSIDAGADNIHINVEKNVEKDEGEKKKFLRISVEDDGRGISETITDENEDVEYDGITYALSFGGRYETEKAEIGKFGWGLSAAATCTSRRTEIFTKQKDENWRWSYVDLDEMEEEGDTRPPSSKEKSPDESDLNELEKDSGTLVIFERCDDIERSTVNGMVNKLTREIPRIYRYYLEGGRTITVNGKELVPKDPLYMMEGCHNPGNIPLVEEPYHEETIKVEAEEEDGEGIHEVTVRVVWLDVEEIRKKDEWSGSWMSEHGLTEQNQGFSLVRNGREIRYGLTHGLFNTHADKNYMRAEIKFPPELDSKFGIQTNKSRLRIKDSMKDRLDEALAGTPEQIHRKTREKIRKLKTEANKETRDAEPSTSEKSAEKADKYLKNRRTFNEEEEEEVIEKIEEKKEEDIQEIENDPELDEEEREEQIEQTERTYERQKSSNSFNVTTETLGSGHFFEADMRGRQANAVLNDGHIFHEMYELLRTGDFDSDLYPEAGSDSSQNQSEASILIDHMLLSAAHAELWVEDRYDNSDEVLEYIHQFRDEWSTALRLFLKHKSEAENEAVSQL